MDATLEFLLRHGYLIVFLWVFSEQIGLPIPSTPVLIAAGALVGTGRMSFVPVLLLGILACLLTDLIWFQLGRMRGVRVLGFLCKISLEPDSCVRRTEEAFARHGIRTLLVSKFVPGLNTAAPPLAGMFQMRLDHFLFWDLIGSVLWIGSSLGVGYLFSHQLELAAAYFSRFGALMVVIVAGSLVLYLMIKGLQRRRFIRDLRVARITPEELFFRSQTGEDLVIVDLRHDLERKSDPEIIPGAIHVEPQTFQERHQDIPRDREIILYCS